MKIRYTLTILLGVLIAGLGITAILGTNLIKEQVIEIADVEGPKLKAATEMEIEINQITNSIFAIMENRPQLSEIEKNISDYDRFRERYEAFPLTSDEEESLAKLDALTLQFGDISDQLILVHTEKQDKSLERIEIFDGNVRDILIYTLKPDLVSSEPQYDIKAQALNEIDINIHEIISASRGYQITQEPFLKDIITEATSELRSFTIQFDQAELAENQRDLFDLLKPDIESIIVLTEDIIELEDTRLALLEELDRSFRQIDTVLDDEIQAAIKAVQEDNEEKKIGAATDMELEINSMRNAIFAIMEERTPFAPLNASITEYQQDRDEYQSLIKTEIEKQTLAKLDALFLQYEEIGYQLLDVHNEKHDKSLERIEIFDGNVRDVLIQTLKPDLVPSESQYNQKAEALNEIDINIHEIISASRGYQIKPDPFLKEIIDESISELTYFKIRFDRADLTENQRDLFDLLKPDIKSITDLTEDIIELEDTRLALLEEFDRSFRQIDTVLDKEIQATSTTKIQAATELEVELEQVVNSIFAVMEQRPQVSNIDQNIADYQRFREEYQSLIKTDHEKEELANLDTLFSQYEKIGSQLIDVHTEKQDKSLERVDIFDGSVRDILIYTLKPDLIPSESQYDIKAQALNEIDINIHEIISASRGYQITPESFLKDIITESTSELRYFTTQFDQAELAENQRDLFDLLKPDIESIIVLTDDIIELEDTRLKLLKQFDSSREKVSKLLDQEIQAIAVQNVQEGRESTKETINLTLIALVILFIVMITVGFVFSTRLGNRLAKIVRVTVAIRDGNLDTPIAGKAKDEIGDLARAVRDMASQLKNTQKEKEEFVAMITHDLKQPLVPISGNAEMLSNPKMGELNEMQKECVDEIAANASRQLSMIDNLVSAQKLGAGAMEYEIEELSSKDILNDCIKTHSPIMKDKKIEYFDSSTEDIKIKGDRRRILEAFTNIIQNAHDFVPEKGKIEIGVNNGAKEVTFFVKDDGEGIPKEKQDKLFKKYGQVESKAKRKFGGTGLGLAVSQELVNGMGGKIWLESEVGKGSTFFFTIPKTK